MATGLIFSLLELNRCKNGDKYPSPDIQNELIQLMSSSMLESIASDIQSAKNFSIMADRCVDVSNCEQLTICLC